MVKQALEILTPAMPGCMEDGNVVKVMSNGVKIISKEILKSCELMREFNAQMHWPGIHIEKCV